MSPNPKTRDTPYSPDGRFSSKGYLERGRLGAGINPCYLLRQQRRSDREQQGWGPSGAPAREPTTFQAEATAVRRARIGGGRGRLRLIEPARSQHESK